MSHALGEVILGDQTVGYYEYDGTSDVVISHIYDTMEEVVQNWRSGRWTDCHCGCSPQEVWIYSSYGNGFHWKGTACLSCHAITGGYDPYDDEVERFPGHPIRGQVKHGRRSGSDHY